MSSAFALAVRFRYHPRQIMENRKTIAETFAALRQRDQIALMPFIAAGFPDLAATTALLPALQDGGANLIEIGIPFSDPVADGPTIQAAFNHALSHKVRVRDVFDAVAAARSAVSIPLLAMVSYSIVFRYGQQRFFADAKAAGFDGLIIPDLPPPEAREVCREVRAAGLDTVLLVSPSSTTDRRREIAELSSGFIYYLSVAGITGARDSLPADLEANVRAIKGLTQKPVCVGFGVAKPEHVKQLDGVADGAIVGSALIRRLADVPAATSAELAKVASEYCRQLLSLVR
jgi:tryptophan synthase alpha chain